MEAFPENAAVWEIFSFTAKRIRNKYNHMNLLLLLYIKLFRGITLIFFFKPVLEMREESRSPVVNAVNLGL